MKKLVLFLALFAGFIGIAHAQRSVTYGLKGGFNASTFSGSWTEWDDNSDIDSEIKASQSGFSAGGFVNINLSKRFALQPELLYAQKGASLDDFQGNSTVTFKSKLGYLDLPVMLRASFGRKSQFFVEVGPQASFIVHNRDYTQTDGTSARSPKNTSTDDLNKVTVGYSSGLGYRFANGISLGLRSSHDFSKTYQGGASRNYLLSDAAGLNGQNPSVRNLVVGFQAEYAFGNN